MSRARAYAKINLALVVGPTRPDGKHEVVTVLQRVDLADTITVTPADALCVLGFEDTLVRSALEALAADARSAAAWHVEIEKDRKSTRLNSSHVSESRMPSSA